MACAALTNFPACSFRCERYHRSVCRVLLFQHFQLDTVIEGTTEEGWRIEVARTACGNGLPTRNDFQNTPFPYQSLIRKQMYTLQAAEDPVMHSLSSVSRSIPNATTDALAVSRASNVTSGILLASLTLDSRKSASAESTWLLLHSISADRRGTRPNCRYCRCPLRSISCE